MGEDDLLIFLSQDKISFFEKNGSSHIVDYTDRIIVDFKVTDSERLAEIIEKGLSNISDNKKKNVCIILANPFYKYQLIEGESFLDHAQEIDDFYNKSGFNEEELLEKTIKTNLGIELFATNKNIALEVGKVISKFGLTIKYVVALKSLGQFEDINMNSALAGQVFESKELLEESDFLTENEVDNKEESRLKEHEKNEKQLEDTEESGNPALEKNQATESRQDMEEDFGIKSKKRSLLLPFLILLILLGIAIGSAMYFKLVKFPLISKFNFAGSESAVEQTIEPLPTLLPEVKTVSKSEMKIMVENGTGIVGQAKKTANVLGELGYTNIETANSDSAGEAETVVEFSQAVSPKDRDEIKAELEAIYSTVLVKEAGEFPDFDVLVTTGKPK